MYRKHRHIFITFAHTQLNVSHCLVINSVLFSSRFWTNRQQFVDVYFRSSFLRLILFVAWRKNPEKKVVCKHKFRKETKRNPVYSGSPFDEGEMCGMWAVENMSYAAEIIEWSTRGTEMRVEENCVSNEILLPWAWMREFKNDVMFLRGFCKLTRYDENFFSFWNFKNHANYLTSLVNSLLQAIGVEAEKKPRALQQRSHRYVINSAVSCGWFEIRTFYERVERRRNFIKINYGLMREK